MKIENDKFKRQSRVPAECSEKGQALMTMVIFTLLISLGGLLSFSSIALNETTTSRAALWGEKSYYVSEAGLEDASYRIMRGKMYAPIQTMTIDGFSATTTIAAVGGTKEVTALGNVLRDERTTKTILKSSNGVSFFYGIQVGDGGVVMGNNTSIVGNVFSNGDINGGGKTQSTVTGTAIAAGIHTIQNITVNQNGSAQNFNNCNIGGTATYVSQWNGCTAGSTQTASQAPAPGTFPITGEQITNWKNDAVAGGTINSITVNTNTSLGPKKINGNLTLGNNVTLTITGTVWVTGTIAFGNNNTLRLSASYGELSGLVIVDGATNVGNNAIFLGSGTAGSYLMLLDTAINDAIDIGNNANGAIFYAPNGTIDIGNNLSLHEATAYKLEISNNSSIIYENGLANLQFSSGPSGGYQIERWKETE
ncbi:hypothetical protein KGQ34_00480 [Patescibacteria group bacterium]|nr:hypothetical protein [Patescibacteria group bacterium]